MLCHAGWQQWQSTSHITVTFVVVPELASRFEITIVSLLFTKDWAFGLGFLVATDDYDVVDAARDNGHEDAIQSQDVS